MQKSLIPLSSVAIALAFTLSPTPPNRIAHGTNAPRAASEVWRVATKDGGTASAVPVALSEGRGVFLTARHVATELGLEAIVEDLTKQRKLKILRHVTHPKADLAVLWVAMDDKPLTLVELDTDPDALVAGLSVFAVGYPGPVKTWFTSRGYLCQDSRFCSATIHFGMSGGAVLDNTGKLLGIIEGFAQYWEDDLTFVYPRGSDYPIAGFQAHHLLHSQGALTPLAPHVEWLREQGALPQE